MKEHEKFFAFILLGGALVAVAIMVYLHPLADSTSNSGAIQILNTIVGALTLAFGGVANALFRINDVVKVSNTPSEPVPTAEASDPSEEPKGGLGS